MSSLDCSYKDKLETEGVKDDSGKLRLDLLPVMPLFLVSDVYTRGAKKYADDNWRKGLKWRRVFGALLRHAFKWFSGERCDPEDGQHHLASVVWCALTLMEYEVTHPELDDRPTNAAPYQAYTGLCEGVLKADEKVTSAPKSPSNEPQAQEIWHQYGGK